MSDAISSCSPSGNSVTIKERTWAGDINAQLDYFTSTSPRTGTLEELLAPGYKQEFGWGHCVLNFCSEEVMHDNWSLAHNSPCEEGRTGRLCGTCQPGLTITPYDLVDQSLIVSVFKRLSLARYIHRIVKTALGRGVLLESSLTF